MRFRNRASDTPHPANIGGLLFRINIDFTDDSMLTLNGSDISEVRNKCSSNYTFSQSTAVNQPRRNGKEAHWDDASFLQFLTAGNDYLFFDAADTDGMFISALVRSNRVSVQPSAVERPFVIDFGQFGVRGYGLHYASNRLAAHTPVDFGGFASVEDPAASSTDYRSISFIVRFNSDQKLYIDNVEIHSDPITLLDLRDVYINENPTRIIDNGPITIGLTSKTNNQTGRDFYDGAMKSVLIGAGAPNAYQRELIRKYHNALEAA